MKSNQIEKWLLLEQTGELSPRRQRMLNAIPEAQQKRAELKAFCASVPAVDVELPPWAVTKITARLSAGHRPVLNFSNGCHFLRSLPRGRGASLAARGWKPALALAACLMAVSTFLNFHGSQNSSTSAAVVVAAVVEDVWNDPLEEDLGRLENLMVAVSGDPLDIMEM